MKNKRKGISLIVLIITIIVIIILAAAIILSFTKSNPIKNAKKAVSDNDVKVAQEAVTMWIGNRWINENNGTLGQEVGALYTGKITKEPSNVDITLDGKTTTIQVTLEELGLPMLEEVTIEKNKVTSIVKNGNTYDNVTDETPGSGSNENTGNNNGTNTEDYEKMMQMIVQLQTKVTNLESQQSTTDDEMQEANKKIDANTNQIDHMLTTLDVNTKTTLFEGTAGTVNASYQMADLSNYQYLIVYANVSYNSTKNNTISTIIPVSDIKYGNERQFAISCMGNSTTAWYYIAFDFVDSTHFYIRVANHGSGWLSPQIFKIEGIE